MLPDETANEEYADGGRGQSQPADQEDQECPEQRGAVHAFVPAFVPALPPFSGCRQSAAGPIEPIWPSVWGLIEHRRDLLDVDAFLGHAQVVVGDREKDRGERRSDGGPDRVADKRCRFACRGVQQELKQRADYAEQDQQEKQPEDFPAMPLGKLLAATQASPWP